MTPKQVVKHFGSLGAAANALTDAGFPVSRQAIHKWVKKGWVPDDRQVQLEDITDGDLEAEE